MAKEGKWYRIGFNDGADNFPCDPPYQRGNRLYDQYVAGFKDGQRAESRDKYSAPAEDEA